MQSGIGNPTSYIFNPAEETEIQDTACINDALHADENYTDASEDEREFEENEGETTFQSGANYLMRRQTSNYCESSSTSSITQTNLWLVKVSIQYTRYLSYNNKVGDLTGVYVFKDSELVYRQKRWKRRIRSSNTDSGNVLSRKKYLASYALRTS